MLVAALLALGSHHLPGLELRGVCAKQTPCTGYAVDGRRWVYAMPPHTGTGTTAHFFMAHRSELNVTACAHQGHRHFDARPWMKSTNNLAQVEVNFSP